LTLESVWTDFYARKSEKTLVLYYIIEILKINFDLLSHFLLSLQKSDFFTKAKMNFVIFGIILIEFCSAWRCVREKTRIKKLLWENGELRIERNQLKDEKERFWNENFGEIEVSFFRFFVNSKFLRS